MSDIFERTVSEHALALSRGEYSSTELTAAYLDRIEKTDGEIGAYLTVTAELALSQAEFADKRRKQGESRGVLDGIPYALKDNICTEGVRTTCASRLLENYTPPYSAFAYERLLAEGAVLLGKLNMDEFAMGSATEYSAFKPTKNPHNTRHVPGGSSGGSAAAVAAREAVFTLGSDTGGSIRQPASFCGVVGIKPTYGRVSRYGLVAFASSLDQIGVLSSCAEDNAIVLSAISGKDSRDATSVGSTPIGDVEPRIGGMRIGFDCSVLSVISEGAREALLSAMTALKEGNAQIVDITLPKGEEMLSAYHIISSAEASSNLSRFDGIRYGRRAEGNGDMEELLVKSRTEGFGEEVKRRIMLGTFALSHGFGDKYYKYALGARERIRAAFREIFEKCDLILLPTTPEEAYRLGEERSTLAASIDDIFCVGANLAGLPALSLPIGRSKVGLPTAVQLIAPAHCEAAIYSAARHLELVLAKEAAK